MPLGFAPEVRWVARVTLRAGDVRDGLARAADAVRTTVPGARVSVAVTAPLLGAMRWPVEAGAPTAPARVTRRVAAGQRR